MVCYCCTKTVSYAVFSTKPKCVASGLTYLPMSFILDLTVPENEFLLCAMISDFHLDFQVAFVIPELCVPLYIMAST